MNTESCKGKGSNSCNMIKDVFVLYQDGALSEECLQEVREHLASCKDCTKYYKEMKKSHQSDAEAEKNSDPCCEELLIPKRRFEELAKRLRREKLRSRILYNALAFAAIVGGMAAAVLICKRRAEER